MVKAMNGNAPPALVAAASKPCLLWTGPTRVRVVGERRQYRRFVYELCRGPLPGRNAVCVAVCGAGNCVEPSHLEARAKPPPGMTAVDDVMSDAIEQAIVRELATVAGAAKTGKKRTRPGDDDDDDDAQALHTQQRLQVCFRPNVT